MPGIIAVVDRDLTNMEYILLEGEAVDNGISVDDQGGTTWLRTNTCEK